MVARNCLRIESAPPLKSRSFSSIFANSSFHCDRSAAIAAALSQTIPVFIHYQFLTPYYEDARL
jgi:hypothetical protein